ncbi:MAG: phosphomannomutase/phosphoglucomutase [Chloroflexi bacterium]|jgi:phosphomannomutase/phosphoglucomutase|nr:phosphomannomutase/phosphoglucomutase [Chloroflexota bacterium]
MSIFKSCDIRGVYGSELTEDTAYRLGRAVGSRMSGQHIIVGGDLRTSTPALKQALIDGLLQSGAHVVDIGIVPTPAFYYAKKAWAALGGVMVTASHNPARYNGFKLMLGDLPITPEALQALARQMQAGDFAQGQGTYRREDILPAYQRALVEAFPALKPRRVVVDAGNGCFWSVAPAVLRATGQQVTELYCTPDGSFPNRSPNPAVPEHLQALQAAVTQAGADFGAAYDGDGDRVIFVDGRGRVQPADRTLVLFIRYLLRQHPGAAVVYDLKSSSVVPDEVQAAGGQPLREKSGHAFIKARLLTERAILGGEISGHYFFGALGGDDALYATLLLLQVLDDLGVSFAEAMDTVPVYPITPDLRLPCPKERAQRILDELAATFAEYPIDTLDGVRVQFPDGWALARLSVTEPLLTLRFEAHSQETLQEIQAQVLRRSPLLAELYAEQKYPPSQPHESENGQ